MSLKGFGGIKDADYISVASFRIISRSINEDTGPLVRHLAIGNFLRLRDLVPFSKHCPNLESLDLATLMGMHSLKSKGRHCNLPFHGYPSTSYHVVFQYF